MTVGIWLAIIIFATLYGHYTLWYMLDTFKYVKFSGYQILAKQQTNDQSYNAFDKKDKYNGGFLTGCRTADNIFILQGLVKRQLSIGSTLVVCFVDFAKAFDLINRHILFHKIMKCGWHGPVIDTLRNLYSKTSFRIKNNGRISSTIVNNLGVNQGGVASGLLFRKYMSDLKTYLSTAHGICINNEIIAHLLWADDLILFSDTFKGLQVQLDGLKQFCSNNHMIVNEIKTKVMVFGNPKRSKFSI